MAELTQACSGIEQSKPARAQTMLNLSKHAGVGVFGHVGNRNLGDEAIIGAVIQNIRQRLPTARIIGFTLDPHDTAGRHHIPAYPIRRFRRSFEAGRAEAAPTQHTAVLRVRGFSGVAARSWVRRQKALLKRLPFVRRIAVIGRSLFRGPPQLVAELLFLRRCYRLLEDIDVLMIAGSNQLLDNFGGACGFPYTLLKWSVLARLAGTRVIYVSVGAGPISSGLSSFMIRIAMTLSTYTSLRDRPSQELLRMLGVSARTCVFPDLAYSVNPTHELLAPRILGTSEQRRKVGINVMPVYDRRYWYVHDADKYAAYVRHVAGFSSALLRDDYSLVFWGTQPRDLNVIGDVLTCLEDELGMDLRGDDMTRAPQSVAELLELVGGLDLVVATRFHGAVLSLLACKPVISICYDRKTDDLMREMGQGDYSIMFDALRADALLDTFRRLERNAPKEVERIWHKAVEYRRALSRQYELLFGPVT